MLRCVTRCRGPGWQKFAGGTTSGTQVRAISRVPLVSSLGRSPAARTELFAAANPLRARGILRPGRSFSSAENVTSPHHSASKKKGGDGVSRFDESKYPHLGDATPQPQSISPLSALNAPDVIPLLPEEADTSSRPKPGRSQLTQAGGLQIEMDELSYQEDEEAFATQEKSKKCTGCGAALQSNDPHAVGYKPVGALKMEQEGKSAVCMRCHSLRHHGVVTPLKVPYEELKEHLKQISHQSCLIVKIVDIFDFSGSFINNFREIAGNNPVVLVGNKVDLLPTGAKQERITMWLKRLAFDMGLKNVRSVHLISAKTGDGVHSLSRKIQLLRKERDVYVVGCTNVGKSTLINRLISINVKGPKKENLITTSLVPGTTLNLIKFPLRCKKKEAKVAKRAYLYDTPGLINSHQMANLLSVDELRIALPKKRIQPVTFRLAPGKTIYFGGLGRLDYVDGPGPLYLTLFLSKEMKIHPTSITKADELFSKHCGTLLVPPLGPRRAAELPRLVAKDITIEADPAKGGLKKAFADVVFSGLGWTSLVTPKFDKDVHLRALAPEGVGMFLREPLMPFEIEKRKHTPGGVRKHGKIRKPGHQVEFTAGSSDGETDGETIDINHTRWEEDDQSPEYDDEESDKGDDDDDYVVAHPPASDGAVTHPAKKKRRSERRKRRQAFLARNKKRSWRAFIKVHKGKIAPSPETPP